VAAAYEIGAGTGKATRVFLREIRGVLPAEVALDSDITLHLARRTP
jgi:hypothetical protein